MVLIDTQPIRERVMQSAVIREEGGLSTLTFQAMGTRCRVVLQEPTRAAANDFLEQMLNWVADFEAKYSRFLDSSLVSLVNQAAGTGWVEVDDETDHLLSLCHEMHFFTRGSFDPTALPLIRLWNWKANPPVLPTEEAIEAVRPLVGWEKVERRPGAIFLPRPGMCLDFGGIGKEYAVDRVVQIAAEHGIGNVLVDFGQDIRVRGYPPGKPAWHVGLEDPRTMGRCWASVAVTRDAVATSGDYMRHFVSGGRRYGHIIDPRTGYPVRNACLSVNVIAPTCTLAGILTTTAFILGPEEGYQLIQRSYGTAGAIFTSQQQLITPSMYEYLVQQNLT